MKFRIAVCPGRIIGRAEMEGFLLPVFHLPHVHRQDAGEDKVGCVQNLLPGAEVPGQQDFPFLPIRSSFSRCKALILVKENGGIRQPEAVDALLYVPHSKEVLSLAGHRPEDGVLHLVGILILVHQNFPVAARHLTAQRSGAAIPGHQQFQRQMLLIGEIGAVHPQLFPPIGV